LYFSIGGKDFVKLVGTVPYFKQMIFLINRYEPVKKIIIYRYKKKLLSKILLLDNQKLY